MDADAPLSAEQDESAETMLDIDLTAAGTAPQGAEQPARRSYFSAPAAEEAAPAPQAAAVREALPVPAPPVEEVAAQAQPVMGAEPPAPAPAAPAPAPALAPVAAAPVVAQAAPSPAPQAQAFVLPVDDLAQMAQASGLQWVNSDADKIAAAQAAIAAEPAPVHVPRERPPVPVLDEGPLVLVETRRDLRELQLPFEGTTP